MLSFNFFTTRGVVLNYINFRKIILISETIQKWLWIQDHGTIHDYAKNKFNQISGEKFCQLFGHFVNISFDFVNIFMLSRPPGATWTRY